MTVLRKLRAILTMGVVSGVFWGTAMLLGRAGYMLIMVGTFAMDLRLAWLIAVLGFIGGTLYATALALLPTRDDQRELGAWRSAVLGAVGGILLVVVILLVMGGGWFGVHVISDLIIPMTMFAALGAGTGYAITGTASHGALPKGEEARQELEGGDA
jgi:hypothetical protein